MYMNRKITKCCDWYLILKKRIPYFDGWLLLILLIFVLSMIGPCSKRIKQKQLAPNKQTTEHSSYPKTVQNFQT